MPRDAATEIQIRAARPDRSTWLSANAGSGKTRVLTDRVARLLLDGTDPQLILCLTYTKAAASEMQNRLFARLGEWAMLEDGDLTGTLNDLGLDGALPPRKLREARRLFARAIETPGGLKIQTIHSFCAALLRRFPMEAGVSPAFAEMEDRAARLLRTEITEDIAVGPDAGKLQALARHFTGEMLDDLTDAIAGRRPLFEAGLTPERLGEVFDQPPGLSGDDVARGVFLGNEAELLGQLIPALLASGPNDVKAGKRLQQITDLDLAALPVLEGVFLTGAGAKQPFSAKINSFPTKDCRAQLANIMPRIEDWMLRVEDAREARLAADAMAKTRALHDFAQVFLPAYAAAKEARGWLDFDDLILRARTLLTNPGVASWVLYRLDGGIDHILVDEAQDTNPVQWQVIEKLAQEFTAGEGSRPDTARTIFVVGDKKQSIYSFQGADPREFDRMRGEFQDRLADVGRPLQTVDMEFSFRSSQAILRLVDQVFADAEDSGFAAEQSHKSFKSALPGRVDLWPLVTRPEAPEKPAWHLPLDIKAPNDPAIILARQVASHIRHLIDTRHPVPESDPGRDGRHPMRPVRPGDFLILVQRRSDLFHEIIRECKSCGLPVAGADRLKVGAEMAVRDIAALLSVLATPEDSLSLATALRSPLFGWSEAQLYDLAQGRAARYLWTELRNRAADFPATLAMLDDLRRQADFLRPYELIERILIRHDGRRNLLARLGPEAEEGLDALLAQAMAYERSAVDSLTGFLGWLETDEMEIKRQTENSSNLIRVMTVHGAKGLEAPVVILPDCGQRRLRDRGHLVVADDTVLWRTAKDASPERMRRAAAEARAAEMAERDRLLYVALTRAEKWLIVAAAGDPGKDGHSWYAKVEAGMQRAGAVTHAFPDGIGMRLEYGDWGETEIDPVELDPVLQLSLPSYFRRPAVAVQPIPASLSPSGLGGAKALPGDAALDEEAVLRRGRQIHLLLEHLPRAGRINWQALAGRLLADGPDAAGADLPDLLGEVAKVLAAPALAPLFVPGALAEVAVTADWQGHRLHGTIDRLIVSPDRVLAVDFKSNAIVPATADQVPVGLLRQMGAYAHALGQVYPGRRIDTALLWTRTATLMALPHDLVTDALCTTQIS